MTEKFPSGLKNGVTRKNISYKLFINITHQKSKKSFNKSYCYLICNIPLLNKFMENDIYVSEEAAKLPVTMIEKQ